MWFTESSVFTNLHLLFFLYIIDFIFNIKNTYDVICAAISFSFKVSLSQPRPGLFNVKFHQFVV